MFKSSRFSVDQVGSSVNAVDQAQAGAKPTIEPKANETLEPIKPISSSVQLLSSQPEWPQSKPPLVLPCDVMPFKPMVLGPCIGLDLVAFVSRNSIVLLSFNVDSSKLKYEFYNVSKSPLVLSLPPRFEWHYILVFGCWC